MTVSSNSIPSDVIFTDDAAGEHGAVKNDEHNTKPRGVVGPPVNLRSRQTAARFTPTSGGVVDAVAAVELRREQRSVAGPLQRRHC